MTIPSTARKAGPLLGTGVQTAWPFTFKVFAAADVAVTIANSAGTETPLVLGTDYSVTLNPNQDTSPGGTVTYPISGTPLAVGSKLSIVGDIDYDQPLDLPSGGNFSPLALENELDRVVMQIQQLREVSERAVVVPVTSDADGTLPAPEAQKILGWDINGTGLQNYDIPDLFSGAVYADWVADTFAGNGTQTLFVLQRAPGAVGNCDVSVDGQTYVPNVDFSLSGATLTFTVAPIAGAEILVRYGSAATQVSSTFSTESQTATAGQTVFSLNNLLYNPGANALAVYVNGLRMVSGVDFLETDIDDVTFTSGLTLGDEVLFIAGRTINESIGAEAVSYLPAGTGAVATTAQAKLRESVSVKDFGAVGDGVTDDTAAFAAARAVTNRYYIPSGTYALSASPDPFLDCFTSGNGVTLVVGGVSYDCSNAFAGPLRYVAASATKTNIVHAKTGNIVMFFQDGSPGTATTFSRTIKVVNDSHFLMAQPGTNGGSCDLLFQRSTLNADPAGNRFNITFEEANDRLLYSFATTASGAPSFDSAWIVGAGTAPYLTFPAIKAQFNTGLSVKQRAAGGFECALTPSSSTQATINQIGGSGTTYMTFRDGAFGFFGSIGTSKQTITGSRGGNAALASLLTALATTGLITDSTTA